MTTLAWAGRDSEDKKGGMVIPDEAALPMGNKASLWGGNRTIREQQGVNAFYPRQCREEQLPGERGRHSENFKSSSDNSFYHTV